MISSTDLNDKSNCNPVYPDSESGAVCTERGTYRSKREALLREKKVDPTKKLCIKQGLEDMARLKQVQQDTIRFQQQKAIQQISQQMVSLALKQVRQKLKTGANSLFHISINKSKVDLLKSTTPVAKPPSSR